MLMKYLFIILFLSINLPSSSICSEVDNEFVILIISQPHIYILSQVHHASGSVPIHIPLLHAHSYASTVSNWYAIYPTFSSILEQYPQLKWLFLAEPQTRYNLTELIAFAKKSNSSYVGHGLYDSEPSIIHHFSFALENPYPDLSSGVLLRRDILTVLVDRLKTHKKPIDFIIDVKYELNQLINELTDRKLTDRADLFCYEYAKHCLTWFDGPSDYACPRTDIQVDDLYIGVKTFVKYHQTRLDLLRKTWLTDRLYYNLFTNEIDPTLDKDHRFIQTKTNTERGHCHKTFAILHYFSKTSLKSKYLIIVDDDTLLSVERVLRLIRCFILSHDLPIVLGERYGYGNYYDYPTGGSGMIFNRQAVEQIISNCECPSSDTPDDMFLGLCMKRLDIPLIHIPELHQAQPNAYSKEWLRHQKAISFHKFEGINVEQIYQTYLHEDPPIDQKSHHPKDEF